MRLGVCWLPSDENAEAARTQRLAKLQLQDIVIAFSQEVVIYGPLLEGRAGLSPGLLRTMRVVS